MKRTKNDLSYNHSKLDFKAMAKTARIAFGAKLNEIHQRTENLMRLMEYTGADTYLEAQWIADAAIGLSIAAETMHTLENAKVREEIEIVNKPPVIHENVTEIAS